MRRTSVPPILMAIVAAITGMAGLHANRQTAPRTEVTGELRQWHAVTLTLDGPAADESAAAPVNPFTDYRMEVAFVHESGAPRLVVPGYFAADGNAAHSSATAGNKWRAHFSPEKTGRWDWRISLVAGPNVAIAPGERGEAVAPFDGVTGTIRVAASDKSGRDFRARGRLRYAGGRYLRFAGTGEYFLKAGSDSPETLLAYEDFDGTSTGKSALHRYQPHAADWRAGDPTWQEDKGKTLIGALNYLASRGVNAISFLTYNAGGDGDNVWPFATRDDKLHYDVSKLDQWAIVFDHAQRNGIYLHFKLQETEIDDNTRGNPGGGGRGGPGRGGAAPAAGAGRSTAAPPPAGPVVESLDGGNLGPERRLYLRELIARFGYHLALNWNLGEENTQTSAQQRAMARYIRDLDPYDHLVVLHSYPDQQENVYQPMLGQAGVLTGLSLQNGYQETHERTVRWITASAAAGVPWVVANDEQGPANFGAPPDPGYAGFAGTDARGNAIHSLDDIRKYTLWGNLMAGGAGVEYYAGYQLPDNDLVLENFRSRDRSWQYAALALEFFQRERVPFWEMQNADGLVGNHTHENRVYCLAKAGEWYFVYLPHGGSADLDLTGVTGPFDVRWFDPRNGGALRAGTVSSVAGGRVVSVGRPADNDTEDWLVSVRRN